MNENDPIKKENDEIIDNIAKAILSISSSAAQNDVISGVVSIIKNERCKKKDMTQQVAEFESKAYNDLMEILKS